MKALFSFLFCLSFFTNVHTETDFAMENKISRLNKHVVFLYDFYTKNNEKLESINTESKGSLCSFEFTEYKHELIRLGVKMANAECSFDPVFKIWKIFINDFKDIEASLFLKEYATVVFFVYKNLITSFINPESKVASTEIFELSGKIMSLPIDQLLDALDVCCRQFMFIMQDYGMISGVNPKEWLKEYWWVIPVSVASFVASIVKYVFVAPFWKKASAIDLIKQKSINLNDNKNSEDKITGKNSEMVPMEAQNSIC